MEKILTLKDVYRLHYELWDQIAETGHTKEMAYVELADMHGVIEEYDRPINDCWCCEWVKQQVNTETEEWPNDYCRYCPIIWSSDPNDVSKRCIDAGSEFDDWREVLALGTEDQIKKAAFRVRDAHARFKLADTRPSAKDPSKRKFKLEPGTVTITNPKQPKDFGAADQISRLKEREQFLTAAVDQINKKIDTLFKLDGEDTKRIEDHEQRLDKYWQRISKFETELNHHKVANENNYGRITDRFKAIENGTGIHWKKVLDAYFTSRPNRAGDHYKDHERNTIMLHALKSCIELGNKLERTPNAIRIQLGQILHDMTLPTDKNAKQKKTKLI